MNYWPDVFKAIQLVYLHQILSSPIFLGFCAGISFSVKFQPGGLQLYENRNSGTCVFCDFCKIFKNTFFVENLRSAASEKQQLNSRFNIKNGVTGILETLLIIYPKNDKQNLVIKVCSSSTK